jgi:16S rRNA (guanine966-N2)-methyltransferase
MRVISGSLGGRLIRTPKTDLRPTSDRTRSGVFSVLEAIRPCEGARVLDLYAGTGSFGIEALSRGAASALFVEKERAHTEVLRGNLRDLSLIDRASVSEMTVEGYLALHTAETFDLIFADPPYSDANESLLSVLRQSGAVAAGALFIYELPRRGIFDFSHCTPWTMVKDKHYGDTVVWFFLFSDSAK